jgi:hypothetical protein
MHCKTLPSTALTQVLCRLFEKEVELFRMISKFIRKVIFSIQNKKRGGGEGELLQISDIYSALDF